MRPDAPELVFGAPEKKEEDEPPTDRRPDLTKAWADHMNDVIEVKVCPACNR